MIRKKLIAGVALILIVTLALSSFPSQASSSASKSLVNGFAKEIGVLKNKDLAAQTNLKNKQTAISATYTQKLQQLETDYKSALDLISKDLQPKLDSAKKALETARTKWSNVNRVKLTTGFFGSDLSRINNVLECIAPYSDGSSPFLLVKRYCANNGNFPKPGDRVPGNPTVTYGGADWQKDDITTINVINANDQYLLDGIKYGMVVPLNPQEFDSTRKEIASSTLQIEKLTTDIANANKQAISTRDIGKFNSQDQYVIALTEAEDEYEKISADIESQLESLYFGQKAAKRASKQAGNLRTTFTTALHFAYNVRALDEIASEPLSYVTSLKSLNSVVKITALSEEADLVDSSYSHQKALRINKICGKVFIKERKFKDLFAASFEVFSKYVKG